MKRLIPFLFLACILSASCNILDKRRVKGNGTVTTEQRTPGNFHSLEISNAIHVVLSQEGTTSVKVKADQNLQNLIRTEEQDGVLHIYQEDDTEIRPTEEVIIYVSMPQVRNLDISGASSMEVTGRLTSDNKISIELSGASAATVNVRAPEIKANVSGASRLRIAGETKNLDLEGEGASEVKGYDLLTENAKVNMSGASSAEVFASVKLDIDASGASGVRYKGNAATVNRNVSGAGSAEKTD